MGRVSDAKEKLLAVAFDLIHENSYGTVSVDHICSRARVNKGSFYYFFKSKTDLVVAAYEEHSRIKALEYERVFSRARPPLERLERWCDYIRATQRYREKKYGHVSGCPYASVGGELATFDKKIRSSSQKLIEGHVKYLEDAIGEAVRRGEARVDDVSMAAELTHAFVIGLLLRAKIYNDLKVLRHLEQGVFALVGATRKKKALGASRGR